MYGSLRTSMHIAMLIALFTATFIPFTTYAASEYTQDTVVINEFMPNPVGSDATGEWIELWNYGDNTIDVSGWTLDTLTFPNDTTIEPDAYILIARSLDALVTTPDIITSFSLANSGETLTLSNADETAIDTVEYTTSQEGRSWERAALSITEICSSMLDIHQTAHTAGTENSNFNTACWPDEEDESPITITILADGEPYTDPLITETPITIDATFSDARAREIDTLTLEIAGETQSLPFSIQSLVNTTLDFTFSFTDGSTEIVSSDSITIVPAVQLSEVYFGDTTAEGWVELYNATEEAVSLSSLSVQIQDVVIQVSENNSSPAPCQEVLIAGAYCTLSFTTQETTDIPFSLYYATEEVDAITVDYIDNGLSYQWITPSWLLQPNVSPGEQNELYTIPQDIIITELVAAPASGEEEWIEIFNASEEEAYLIDWYFSESIYNDTCDIDTQFPPLQLSPQEHVVITASSLGVTLNNSGDTIYVCASDNTLIDGVTYPSLDTNESWSRQHENTVYTDNFAAVQTATPGTWNAAPELVYTITSITLSTDGNIFTDTLTVEPDDLVYVQVQTEPALSADTQVSLELHDGTSVQSPFSVSLFTDQDESTVTARIGESMLTSEPVIVTQPLPDVPLIISEVYASPQSGEEEWLELYNPSDTAVDASLVYITETLDSETTCASGKPLASRPITAGAHVTVDGAALAVSLNNGGDTMYLCRSDGLLLDTVTYPVLSKGMSFARTLLDGEGYSDTFEMQTQPTPGSFTKLPTPSAEIPVIAIADARQQADETVSVRGIITVAPGMLEQDELYIQDESGGIRVVLDAVPSESFVLGDYVDISGTVSEAYQETHIADAIITPRADSAPFSITSELLTQSFENHEGRLVNFSGTITANYGSTFDITSSNDITVRVSLQSASIDTEAIEKTKGDTVEVTGVLSQYNDAYRVLPRVTDEVIITSTVAQSNATPVTTSTKKANASRGGATTSQEIPMVPPSLEIYAVPASEEVLFSPLPEQDDPFVADTIFGIHVYHIMLVSSLCMLILSAFILLWWLCIRKEGIRWLREQWYLLEVQTRPRYYKEVRQGSTRV